jgi:hypothetical protein
MNENPSQSSFSDRLEERRQRRHERRGGEWMWGILLILLAGILFLQNMKIYIVNNWWALFILLPALGSFATAWRVSREAGRFNARARSALIICVVLVLVAAMFLFSLNWTILGPVLLALAGIGLIVNGMLPN